MTAAPATALYLLPTGLDTDVDPRQVLPQANLEVMAGLRHFVVENVRSARRFLRRCHPAFPIDDCTFRVLDVNTPASEVAGMLRPLEQGCPMGVISEAGCPAVADPGADLVAAAQARGLRVVPLVGPSSILMGLMASGMCGQSFTFLGYLPIEARARESAMRDMERDIRRHGRTQIFIETPYRNTRLVAELCRVLPPGLRLCVACDITGPGESIVTQTLQRWASASLERYAKVPAIFLLNS